MLKLIKLWEKCKEIARFLWYGKVGPSNSIAVKVTHQHSLRLGEDYKLHSETQSPMVLTKGGTIILNFIGTKKLVMDDLTVIPPCSLERIGRMRIRKRFTRVVDENNVTHLFETQNLPYAFVKQLANGDYSNVDIIIMPRISAMLLIDFIRRNRSSNNQKRKQLTERLYKVYKDKVRSLRRVKDVDDYDYLLRTHGVDKVYKSDVFAYYPVYPSEVHQVFKPTE